ncbi:hypothetical protein HII31_11970 [Pseudocercospora fuligena]|uniref:Survival motor neuron Tudor domain-containing protein n=1 Tax=Pseudocercospora fuligena TaxID=685502 RepID=A0A8H6R914_9PEZI|nr:hypothetical protein HII31_11970 [Pseudocercospora fuligena]
MAAQAGVELSHEEVWDDSDLVQNWNEAFEEYKKYHSLAAKGEKVQQSATPNAKAGPNGALKPSSTPVNFVPAPATPQGETATSAPNIGPGSASVAQPSTSNLPSAPPGLASLPQTLLSSSKYMSHDISACADTFPAQNDDLKNIMMSWYYAGYYTGLYEGQQKAWASMQEMQQEG